MTPAAPSAAFSSGKVVGNYLIGELIGQGGMGAVYSATHLSLKKAVALKVLSSALVANDEARTRFLREGEAASRIRHPHVVDVTDVGVHEGQFYLVMERLFGESLSDHLAGARRLPVEDAVEILLPTISAVQAGHDASIIHRDLKPHNIFLERSRSGRSMPKVLDFGVSKFANASVESALTGTGAFLGTVSYMSPEQARGAREIGPASDQYALGLVLYECLTGRSAFSGGNVLSTISRITSGQFAKPRDLRSDLPESLQSLVLKTLALDPQDRFPSLQMFAQALLPFASPKVRALWEDEFSADRPPPAPLSTVPRPAPLSATMALPEPPGGAGNTRILNAAGASGGLAPESIGPLPVHSPDATTMRGSAVERRAADGNAGATGSLSRGLWMAGAAAALGLVVLLVMNRRGTEKVAPAMIAPPASPAVLATAPPSPPSIAEPVAPRVTAAPEKVRVAIRPASAIVTSNGSVVPLLAGDVIEVQVPTADNPLALQVRAEGFHPVSRTIADRRELPEAISLERQRVAEVKKVARPVRAAAAAKAEPSVSPPAATTPPDAKRGTNNAFIVR